MRFAHALLAVAVCVGSIACGGADPSQDDQPGASEDDLTAKSITDKDNGKTITITQGQTVNVSLGANATTGYAWMVKSVDKSLGQPTIKYAPDGGAVGSGGTTKLTWKTNAPFSLVGTHHVELMYQRPWAELSPPAKTFSFTLSIKAAPSAGVQVTEADAGKTVTAKVGQPVVLSLPSTPDAGYSWQVSQTDKTFGYPTEKYISNNPDPKAMGGSGTSEFTWKTGGPLSMVGTHHVELVYQRPWAETVPPTKTFAFSVKIEK